MRLAPPTLQCIVSATSNTTMSSSGFNARGRSIWRRGFCDRPWSDGRGGGSFVSGDSHMRTVRDANYGHRQGHRGNFGIPGAGPQQLYRPWQPPASRPPPRPKPADYRNWVFSLSQPPPQCERFTVLSYNILADYLARDHQSKLYFHIPPHILDWEWRKRKLLFEFGLWSPDIMCLQEVDRFHDLEEALTVQGYSGIWKVRTGSAIDGCAIFWRTNRFELRHEEQIEFNKLGLRDNVAQICVLESTSQNPATNGSAALPTSSDHPREANRVVVCNIHVLYNPKRGEIKLGQVRTLLDRACTVSSIWNDAPVIICGDFNCTPKSPLYSFISEKKLNLSGLARDQVSGQYSACLFAPRPYLGSGLYRVEPPRDNNIVNAVAVKQGHFCTGIQYQHKPQNDVENTSLMDNIASPQRMTAMLDVSGENCSYSLIKNGNNAVSDSVPKEICQERFDSCCTESSSAPCRVIDSPKETVDSCDKITEITADIGNVRGQELPASTVSCNEDHFFRGVESWHCEVNGIVDQYSKSNPDISDEQVDHLHLCSSSKAQELSHGLLHASSDEVKNSSNFYPRNPSVSNNHVDATIELDKKLPDDVLGLSSSENASESISLKVGVSFSDSTECPSSDSISNQEKPDLARQKPYECKPIDSSSCGDSALDLDLVDSSHDGIGKTTLEDTNLVDDDQETVDMYAKMLENVTEDSFSHNVNSYDRHTKPHPEEASQSPGEAPTNGLPSGQLEDFHSQANEPTSKSHYSGFGQNDEISDDFHFSEETSDRNFLEELHGRENFYEFREDIASNTLSSSETPPSSFPNTCETDSFSSLPGHSVGKEGLNFDRLNITLRPQPQLDPTSFVQERNIYDPYLWTPMEIETASGNAECTLLEHNLKLKSAYAEVEDYAGTKDSSREPQVTSYNRQFMGTVDYIWFSEGLETVKVLDTIPKHVLERTPGFPTQKWGSDHLAIVCQLAFRKGLVE